MDQASKPTRFGERNENAISRCLFLTLRGTFQLRLNRFIGKKALVELGAVALLDTLASELDIYQGTINDQRSL